jgi:RNA polymerase sigma factor (sigma-70 family)
VGPFEARPPGVLERIPRGTVARPIGDGNLPACPTFVRGVTLVIRISDVRNGRGDYASLDDRMLVLDFQAGDPEAFVEIHTRYGGLARYVCRRLLNNSHDTDDAFQETMIRVFQGLYHFNGRYALQPWISRIATNVSLDVIRSRQRRPVFDERAVEDHDHEDLAEGPEEAFERLVERDHVLAALSELPDTHRRALILRELEGRSHREIGEAIGISPAQAKALIHRAKGNFRRRWMQKAVERGGVAGISLVPLVWVVKVGDTVRRFADRAGHAVQAAQAAVPDVVNSAAQTVAGAAGGGVGERVIAAGMTLLVAGGITVGAVTVVRDTGGPADATRAESVVVAESVPSPNEVILPNSGRTLETAVQKDAQGRPQIVEDPVAVDVSPAEEVPASTPSPAPSTSPSPSPSPSPTSQPAYNFTLETAFPLSSICPCDLKVRRLESSVRPSKQQSTYIRETLAVTGNGQGVHAFDLRIYYEAWLSDSAASFYTTFSLETNDGSSSSFSGTAGFVTATETEFGVDYVLSGSYQRLTESAAPWPDSGPLTVTLRMWGEDPALFGVEVALAA